MMTEKQGMIIISTDGVREQLFCENRGCKLARIDYAYSWEHFNILGWEARKVRSQNDGLNKDSPYNPTAKSSDGSFVEIYCPDCKSAK